MTEHLFRIPIGDWSGDGHGKCDWYTARSNKPVEEVREAYFAARERMPTLCPERYCDEYEESRIKDPVLDALEAAGAPAHAIAEFRDDCPDDLSLVLAEIVVWFCMQGDPELRVELVQEEKPPMLIPFGDPKGRSSASRRWR